MHNETHRTRNRNRTCRAVASAVAVVLALGLAGACGGGTETKRDSAPTTQERSSPPANAESAESAKSAEALPPPALTGIGASDGRVLDQRALDAAVLADGDVPGFRVAPMDAPPPGGESADTAACAPLTAVIGGRPEPRAKAVAYRQLTGPDNGSPAVSEFLTAHGTKDATALVRGLRAAVESCAGGFTAKGGDDGPSTYTAVKRLRVPEVGDDTLAYQVTGDFGGTPVPLVFQVVRVGGTVATFYTANLDGAATPELPEALPAAQAAKLT
ncbi:hypothetical protein [Streptomyces paludis]|uniref:Sensor domain-containing protein n=1 Tax=Streptomyces paludis TaxID=2282738 RepID=A0A345HTK1_9ACTN|nr:hypothetical protein [Streptomyces paludis]AXG80025.1 hypothetical protein DVK44_22875 [Streptomyces paludis]